MRRAVFSELQRRGLERRFQMQKYISKPERKKLAEKLGLKDSQVGNWPFTLSIQVSTRLNCSSSHVVAMKSDQLTSSNWFQDCNHNCFPINQI